MMFVPREFGVNPEVFDRSGKSAGREKTTELDRNSTKGARDVHLSTRTIFGKSLLDFRGSDAFIGYYKQFKNVQLDSLGVSVRPN